MKIAYSPLKYLLLLVLLLSATLACAADPQPSGTVKIDETQVMLIVGGDMGGGKLDFNGTVHDFKVGGLTVGAKVGIQDLRVSGEVYYLNNVQDFPGIYFEAQAGFSVVGGESGMWLKNDKGVTMHLKSSNEGLAINIGVDGLQVKMD